MAAAAKRDLDDLLEVFLYQDSSDSSGDSSDEDDLDILFLSALFPTTPDNKTGHFPRINLEDLTDLQCEEKFR